MLHAYHRETIERHLSIESPASLVNLPAGYAGLTNGRRCVVLASLAALFLAFAASSLASPLSGAVLCAGLLALTALVVPPLGIALVVVCVPIRAIFGLSPEHMQMILAVGLISVALRHLPLLAAFVRGPRPPLLLTLALFIVLFGVRTAIELLQFGSAPTWVLAKEAAFYGVLLVVALAAHEQARDRRFANDLLAAVAIGVALTIAVDAIDLYFPITGGSLGLWRGYPNLRFSGLHDNPNATGKYLAFGALLACCGLWAAQRRRDAALAVAAVVIVTLAIAATLSKGTLTALFGALAAFAVWQGLMGRRRLAGRAAATLLLVTASIATWYVACAPWTYARLLHKLAEMHRGITEVEAQVEATRRSTAELIEMELRLTESYSMKVTDPALRARVLEATVYTKRDCGWTCTGQRDRLWTTGIRIVADHWLIGIGPHRWVDEYMGRLQFPFDTPHNGLLELWGGYGVLGALLYLALAVQLLQLAARSLQTDPADPRFVFLAGTSLYAMATLLTELVDPEKFLSMNPHAVWLWIFVAAQAAIQADGRTKA